MTAFNIGKDISVEVDVAKIMSFPNVVAGLVDFAIRQRLTNAHASITATVEPDEAKRKAQSEAAANKLLDSMLRGEYAIAERGSRADELTTEMRKMAEVEVRAAMKKAGLKVDQLEKGAFSKAVAAHATAHEARFKPIAEARLAIKVEPTEAVFDMAALGLVKKADEPKAPETPVTEETPAE